MFLIGCTIWIERHRFELDLSPDTAFLINIADLFPPLEALPDRFWDMILNRCPNLEELALCSFSSCTRIFNFTRVTEGHWPKLHSLTLGAFGYQSDFSLGPAEDSSFGQFLDAHPGLKFMRLQWNFKRWMSPAEIPLRLPPTALPALDTFIGIYQQLVGLPNADSIEALDLTCEPLHESRVFDISDVLRTLTSLKTLDLWAHVLDPTHNHSHLFYHILSACPRLTDFHFMCTTKFTSVRVYTIRSFPSSINELYSYRNL
jgi:hypothetical protein